MKLSHSTLVLPSSLVDFVRSKVLNQIRGLYDGKVELRGSGPESLHRLEVVLMDNGAPSVTNQHITITNIQFGKFTIEPENPYSAASVLAIGFLEEGGENIMPVSLRFRVFLYQEHKPNAYIHAL